MTGRKIDVLFPKILHAPGEVAVDVENLALEGGSVAGVNFYARAGEITGIAGLVGCGKSELARAIYGLESMESARISGKFRGHHDNSGPGLIGST
jgi:ribose transport system ATP-binding protein